MRCLFLTACVFTAGVFFAGAASAQEVVHVLSGTVSSVDPQGKTIKLTTNDGSDGSFSFGETKATAVDFDRNVQAHALPVANLKQSSDEVLVFYYGNNSVRTALAAQDLGPGPFDVVEGSVTKYDRHQHELTLKTNAGKTETFRLDPKAVADTMNGAVAGDRFDPAKGDNVRVIATKGSGTETAMFVRD